MSMSRSFRRRVGRGLALARTALGVVAVTTPASVARPWVGPLADEPNARLLGRALGGRDLALGIGALLSRDQPDAHRLWLTAGAIADSADVAATMMHFGSLPKRSRWTVLAAAAGGVALALVALSDADP